MPAEKSHVFGRTPDTTPIYLNLYINLDESPQLLTELTGSTPTPTYRCSTQLLLITSNLPRTIIVNSSHLLDLVSFITRTLQGKIYAFDYIKNPEEKKNRENSIIYNTRKPIWSKSKNNNIKIYFYIIYLINI